MKVLSGWVAILVAFAAMRLQVGGDLGLQRRQEHPAGSLADDVVEQGSPVHPVLRRLVADDLQHGCRLLPAARSGATVDQAGGYAAGVTGSTIHNFRSYLNHQGSLCHKVSLPKAAGFPITSLSMY